MRDIFELIEQNAAGIMIALAAVLALLLAYCIVLNVKINRLCVRRRVNLNEGNAQEFANCLNDLAEAQHALRADIGVIDNGLADVRKSLGRCFAMVGVVRYNAFPDVGGEQSFSLALLDSEKNGMVISNLYGRQDSRLYVKEVSGGQGDRPLTGEETKAIEAAIGS